MKLEADLLVKTRAINSVKALSRSELGLSQQAKKTSWLECGR